MNHIIWKFKLMLKDKCKFITESECGLISQVACDIASGNYLIRPRNAQYWAFWNEMVAARNAEMDGTATDKQKEMCEYERQASDYSYWRNLPLEKKLFVEVDEI
jgi:hypothetical protein